MESKKKFLIVFGTRPEALKMVPLIKELNNEYLEFQTKVCVTAQHRDMLDQVLNTFSIKPDYDLDLMSKNQTLSKLTEKILKNFQKVLDNFNPDLVFVHGDTTTSFAISLACFYNRTKVAHVEAGLRTYDIMSPWPEEFNRQVTSKISSIHFAPTEQSKKNLIKENIPKESIVVTGNTIIDNLFLALNLIKENKKIALSFENKYNFNLKNKTILITGHRRENFGEGFINICDALAHLSLKFKNVNFIYPVHLNPNVKNIVEDKLANIDNIFLIEPLGYLEFVFLMSKSYIILTDSGGIQEEAPSLDKPVLVMRNSTERPEALAYNKVKLVGTNKTKIIFEVSELINNESYYKSFLKEGNPYGDGKAAKKIVKFLKQYKHV